MTKDKKPFKEVNILKYLTEELAKSQKDVSLLNQEIQNRQRELEAYKSNYEQINWLRLMVEISVRRGL